MLISGLIVVHIEEIRLESKISGQKKIQVLIMGQVTKDTLFSEILITLSN